MTIIFILALHVMGLICILPLSRRIPLWLLASTGFVWGLLLWMAGSLVVLFLNLPYTWLSMSLLLLPLILAAAINLKRKTYPVNPGEWILIIASFVGMTGLAFLLTRNSYVFASTDSFNYIFHGKVLARSGLVPWAVNNFTKLGSFSSIIQMSSQLLPGGFFSGYQTIMGVILLVVLFISMWISLKREFSPFVSLIAAGALTTTLGANTFLNHLFYIHNNLPAAVFLFLSLYSFWQFYRTDAGEWNILGIIALMGFSFTRIEGPLYAVIILLMVISIKPQAYRKTLELVLPYTTATLLWHIFLLTNVVQNEQLSQTNLLLIIAALIGLTAVALFSKWIPAVINSLPEVLLSSLVFGVILSILIEPDHMISSITHIWQNLINLYFWGWTWFVVLAGVPFLLLKNQNKLENRLLLFSLSGYILIVILLVLARIPYRLGQTDSANRLMLQILPLILFAITSKTKTLKNWFSPVVDPTD